MFKIKSSTRELIVRNENEEKLFNMCLATLMGECFPVPAQEVALEPVKEEVVIGAGSQSGVDTAKEDIPTLSQERSPIVRQGFSGFAHLTCEHCGEVLTTCLKHKITAFSCPHCGEKTELEEDGIRQVTTNCECGKSAKYITNSTEGLFDIPCINCGNPVAVSWNKQQRRYTTIK